MKTQEPAPPGTITQTSVVVIRDGRPEERIDELAVEEPMEIRVVPEEGGRRVRHSVAVTMRTPGHDFELAAGFLFTEGVIRERPSVWRIAYCDTAPEAAARNIVEVFLAPGVVFDPRRFSRNVYTSSSCGICGRASIELVETQCPAPPAGPSTLTPDLLAGLPERLQAAQTVFSHTGGLHAAALFDATGGLLLLREDVGRHNALDKVIGALLLERRLPASDTLVLVSGRASYELVQKAVMAGIPTLAAVGAPSSLAVDLARQYGMTLVGFLRDGRFNVYSGVERLAVGSHG